MADKLSTLHRLLMSCLVTLVPSKLSKPLALGLGCVASDTGLMPDLANLDK